MSERKDRYTSIKVLKHHAIYWKIICEALGKSQTQLFGEFALEFYQKVSPCIDESKSTHKPIIYSFTILAGIIPDVVSGSRQFLMKDSNEKLDAQMYAEIDKKFAQIEGKKKRVKLLKVKMPLAKKERVL